MVKKVNNIKTADASDLVKKLTMMQRLVKFFKKIVHYDHDKYITNQVFNKLTSENFDARLNQANLARKNNTADFVKQTDFDEKLKLLNTNVTLKKARRVDVTNKLDDLSKKIKPISTKGLITCLINNYITVQNTLVKIDHKII